MRHIGSSSSRAITAALGLALLAASACGTSTPADHPPAALSTTPPASSAPVSSSPTATPPATAPAAGCDTGTWQTAPLSVTHQVNVPPVPVIKAVRAATHPECGYDRLVLDITGAAPGYTVKYASRVTADPSGKTIAMPGRRYLLITLRPAQAHANSGSPTVPRNVQVLGYPVLAGWALAGDFEGVVTLAAGLRSVTSIRVGELPGRLYIDFKK
jgi:hypothetical protein